MKYFALYHFGILEKVCYCCFIGYPFFCEWLWTLISIFIFTLFLIFMKFLFISICLFSNEILVFIWLISKISLIFRLVLWPLLSFCVGKSSQHWKAINKSSVRIVFYWNIFLFKIIFLLHEMIIKLICRNKHMRLGEQKEFY